MCAKEMKHDWMKLPRLKIYFIQHLATVLSKNLSDIQKTAAYAVRNCDFLGHPPNLHKSQFKSAVNLDADSQNCNFLFFSVTSFLAKMPTWMSTSISSFKKAVCLVLCYRICRFLGVYLPEHCD